MANLSERQGRKAMGLKPITVTTAKPPKTSLLILDARSQGVLYGIQNQKTNIKYRSG